MLREKKGLKRTALVNSNELLAGVVQGKLIPILQL